MHVNRKQLLQSLPPYKAREEIISQNQGVFDIMQEIGKAHTIYAADYEKICNVFDTGNIYSTCQKIFNFCKVNIKYKIESEEKQSTRSPAAIVALGESLGGDCKHYSLFIAGILDAISRTTQKKINWEYRFSSYRFWDNTPHHVFIVVTTADKKEIWIDPVLSVFNEHKLYTSSITKKVSIMPLVRMSGVYDNQVGKIKILKKVAAKVVKVVKKVSLTPARNAFLALVGLNVHGFATSLLASSKDPARKEKLKTLWEKTLAGNYSALEGTFTKGAKKKRILGIDENTMISGTSVGVVQVAAILAAAAPIIAALSAFFKGTGDKNLDAVTDAAIDTVKTDVLETGAPTMVTPAPGETIQQPALATPGYASSSSPINTGQTVYKNTAPGSQPLLSQEEIDNGTFDQPKTIIPGVPNVALYAGAGLLLVMMAKKK